MGNYNFELDLDTCNTMSIISRWINEKCTVLEFGPANGRLTKYLKQIKKCSVTIVEIDEKAGDDAKKFAEEAYIGAVQGDIEQYKWLATEKKYDYIIFADVLEHLSNPAEVLRNCISLLKESGEILVSIPNISHNSILIDLYNDEFNYDKTGLLDQTHIHFFTHKSFEKMIKRINMFIYKIEPIYSRVGNNEIENTYDDVPSDVRVKFRQRDQGSIYQYVYRIGMHGEKENLSILYDEIDKYAEQESTCFLIDDLDSEVLKENSISQIYLGKKKNSVVFNFFDTKAPNYFRWDPLEHNCIIMIKEAYADCQDGKRCRLKYLKSNAVLCMNNLMYFTDNDPMIFYKVEDLSAKIIRIVFEFYLVKYDFSEDKEFSYIVEKLKVFSDDDERVELEKVRTETIKQLYEDVEHREKDIVELKDHISYQAITIEQQSETIEQLNKKVYNLTHPIHHLIAIITEKWSKK